MAATGPIERPKTLRCKVCGGRLELLGEWHCPKCQLTYNVIRGEVGEPLWRGPAVPEGFKEIEVRPEGQPDLKKEEIEAKYGVEFTPEGWEVWKNRREEIRAKLGRS